MFDPNIKDSADHKENPIVLPKEEKAKQLHGRGWVVLDAKSIRATKVSEAVAIFWEIVYAIGAYLKSFFVTPTEEGYQVYFKVFENGQISFFQTEKAITIGIAHVIAQTPFERDSQHQIKVKATEDPIARNKLAILQAWQKKNKSIALENFDYLNPTDKEYNDLVIFIEKNPHLITAEAREASHVVSRVKKLINRHLFLKLDGYVRAIVDNPVTAVVKRRIGLESNEMIDRLNKLFETYEREFNSLEEFKKKNEPSKANQLKALDVTHKIYYLQKEIRDTFKALQQNSELDRTLVSQFQKMRGKLEKDLQSISTYITDQTIKKQFIIEKKIRSITTDPQLISFLNKLRLDFPEAYLRCEKINPQRILSGIVSNNFAEISRSTWDVIHDHEERQFLNDLYDLENAFFEQWSLLQDLLINTIRQQTFTDEKVSQVKSKTSIDIDNKWTRATQREVRRIKREQAKFSKSLQDPEFIERITQKIKSFLVQLEKWEEEQKIGVAEEMKESFFAATVSAYKEMLDGFTDQKEHSIGSRQEIDFRTKLIKLSDIDKQQFSKDLTKTPPEDFFSVCEMISILDKIIGYLEETKEKENEKLIKIQNLREYMVNFFSMAVRSPVRNQLDLAVFWESNFEKFWNKITSFKKEAVFNRPEAAWLKIMGRSLIEEGQVLLEQAKKNYKLDKSLRYEYLIWVIKRVSPDLSNYKAHKMGRDYSSIFKDKLPEERGHFQWNERYSDFLNRMRVAEKENSKKVRKQRLMSLGRELKGLKDEIRSILGSYAVRGNDIDNLSLVLMKEKMVQNDYKRLQEMYAKEFGEVLDVDQDWYLQLEKERKEWARRGWLDL